MRKRPKSPSRALEVRSFKGRRGWGWKRILLTLMLLGALCFGGLFAAVMHGSFDHIRQQPDVMVILGCQVKPWGPSVLLQDRLEEGLAYWQEHPEMTIVVTGGQGSDEHVTEARAMADYLMERGVPREQILLEEDSHNTFENFRFTYQLLVQQGYDMEQTQVVVVSNGFHLTRARMLAQRTGFEEVSTLAAPSSHAPSRLKMYIREPLALVKSFLLDRG